jgi:CheY-like chemotaxis protein/CBS domain-containing protein
MRRATRPLAVRTIESDGTQHLSLDAGVTQPLRAPKALSKSAGAVPISEIMSPTVIAMRPDVSVEQAVAVFRERGISGAPIVDERGKLIGVVSESDLLEAAVESSEAYALAQTQEMTLPVASELEEELNRAGYHYEKLPRGTVGEVMTPFVFSLSPDASVARAAALMAFEGIHRIVVLDEHGVAVGILSSLDLARWIAASSGFEVPAYTQRQRQWAGFVVLPEGEPETRRSQEMPPVESEKEPILVVEDDPDVRDEVAELLRDHGYHVETATDGRDALQRLSETGRPGLILLDLVLPVMDGWALRHQLLKDPELADVPVVLLSGAADVRAEAAALKAAGYLSKPFAPEAVLDAAHRYCS